MTTPLLTTTTCPVCQVLLQPETKVVLCDTCGTAYHWECWQAKQCCVTPGCNGLVALRQGVENGDSLPEQTVPIIPPPPPQLNAAGQVPGVYPVQQGYFLQDITVEQDNTLVMRSGTSLPPLCICTLKRDTLVKRRRTEYWSPIWMQLLLFFALGLIGIIVNSLLSKKGKLEFYLDRDFAGKRLLLILGNWCLFFLIFTGAVMAFQKESTMGLGFLLVLISVTLPLLIYFLFLRLYIVQKIENGYIWLKFHNPKAASAIYTAYYKV